MDQPNAAEIACRKTGGSKRTVWLCLLLALMTVAVYLPVVKQGFTNFDDPDYVSTNPHVQAGLTMSGVKWAFTQAHAANWHPLTWLSHLLDCELYGLEPAGHHLTSVFFHTADTLLLFGLLQGLTGAFWRSAFVAALFALHPLHVESVAWVAERKDVLSTFFFLLTLWAYASYANPASSNEHSASSIQEPASSDQEQATRNTQHASRLTFHDSLFYLLSLSFFALGLMSKPMLVTLPFVLVVLDYWPLERFQLKTQNSKLKTILGLLLEKVPFFALSAGSCAITLIVQQRGGAMAPLEGESGMSLESRVMNTPISYMWYLGKLFWPSDLAVIYPYVRMWPLERVLLATALLVALTGAAVWQGRRWAYVLVGWLWYVGTLVPVIGLVKVGAQSIADRYMYIPSIGLFIVLAWGVADLTAGWARRAVPLAVGAAVVLAACAVAVGAQLLYWQNTESLFRHALAVTRDNYVAYDNLGFWFAQHGELELAKRYYRLAMRIAPESLAPKNHLGWALIRQKRYEEALGVFEGVLRNHPQSAEAHTNLGTALSWLGKTDEAIRHLRESLRLNPEHALTHYNLGNALANQDQLAEAADEFRLAAELNPRYTDAHYNLAVLLAKQGKSEEAKAEFRQALALQPDLTSAHYGLGELLVDQGKLDEAIAQFTEVLGLQPNHGPSWLRMGLARAKQGKQAEAAEAFSTCLRLNPDDPEAHCQLAAILAGQHKTPEAVQHYREALKLQPDLPEALNNLAWILAANPDPQVRNGQEAVELAERACKLTDYKQPLMIGTLAAAYAEAGRFNEAMATAEKARTLAEQSNQVALAARNRELLELYRSGQAVRDTQ